MFTPMFTGITTFPPPLAHPEIYVRFPEDDAAVRDYAARLGQEHRDRRIRDAFGQLSNFSETLELVRDSRSRVDHLFLTLDDVSSAVERLWELIPYEITDELFERALEDISGSSSGSSNEASDDL